MHQLNALKKFRNKKAKKRDAGNISLQYQDYYVKFTFWDFIYDF